MEGIFEDVCRMCGGAPQVEAMTSSQSLARLTASSISLLTGPHSALGQKRKAPEGAFRKTMNWRRRRDSNPRYPGYG